jgi:hypothetical protein
MGGGDWAAFLVASSPAPKVLRCFGSIVLTFSALPIQRLLFVVYVAARGGGGGGGGGGVLHISNG